MKIVIMGNASVHTDLTEEVNSSDLVIRFNVATKNNFNINTGVKTDILCISNLSSVGRGIAKYKKLENLSFVPDLKEVWFARPAHKPVLQFWFKPWSRQAFREADYSKFVISRNGLQDKKVVYFGRELFSECCRMLGIADDFGTHEPSTGFLALQYVLRHFDSANRELLMTGFTFEGHPMHPWQKEKQIVLELQNQGVLRLVD